MRWAGQGAELWRVRVDLFAEPLERRQGDTVVTVAKHLKSLLTFRDDEPSGSDSGVDLGTGAATRSVVGLLFWVRADDVGAAAATALDIARQAGGVAGVGPELYDVTVIPRAAVVLPGDPRYPRMPD
jgi:hypothetical protein